MSIFRRRKNDTSGHGGEAARAAAADGDADVDVDVDEARSSSRSEAGAGATTGADPATDTDPVRDGDLDTGAEAAGEGHAPVDRSAGPYDVSEVDDDGGRLDLGSIRMSGVDGMELRLELDPEQQHVIAATAVLGDSGLQVQAFAAPRSAGLWSDIRAEIAEAVHAQGGSTEVSHGVLGAELSTRMPTAGPDGRTVYAPSRFLGVDGPRWFLRGVLSGRAAIDEKAAAPLVELFRDVVVVRGGDPMAPRELLPLRLPETEAHDTEGEQPAAGLDPFERGPEITEVR